MDRIDRTGNGTLVIALIIAASALLRGHVIPVCREWTADPAGEGARPLDDRGEIPVDSMDCAAKLLHGIPVDLNRASAEDLTLLDGIGPVLAGRIVERRERSGPFESVEELLDINGIGPKKLEKIRESIVISN